MPEGTSTPENVRFPEMDDDIRSLPTISQDFPRRKDQEHEGRHLPTPKNHQSSPAQPPSRHFRVHI